MLLPEKNIIWDASKPVTNAITKKNCCRRFLPLMGFLWETIMLMLVQEF